MLRAIHGNRTDQLFAQLCEALPPAGLELPTFDRFVEHTWTDEAAGLGALDRSQLAAAIASVLADDTIVRALPAVQSYLAAAPAQGDRAGPRRVQLAEHVADLAWRYAQTRPEWMPAFVAGRVPAELEGNESARWQARLVGEAIARAGNRVPVPMLPWARRRAGLAVPRVEPVAVFGVSYLQRAQLDALADLATASEVTVYLLDPCAQLWDDVARGTQVLGDPLPLVVWGRAVRDTMAALVEKTGGDIDDAFGAHAHGGTTALGALLDDVAARRAPGDGAARPAAGVTVLACPDARRELEVVAAEIRAQLDRDPALQAREITVWIASNPERYLAQAPAAFGAVGVPVHQIDAPIDDRGRIGEAVLALLELPLGALARPDLLRVLTHPAVLAGHPHVDAVDWIRWIDRLGIVHGANDAARTGTYLEHHPGRFHWEQGVRRLALGAFMTARGAATIGGVELAPEEVAPEDHASAATFALLVRSLCADAAWLGTHAAPLAEWAEIFVGLVDSYLARTDETARDLERVRSMLAGIAHVDLDGRRVGFREAREHAARRLVAARSDRGEPLASGVMVAPLAAMRAVPCRLAFVVGLDERAFPAGDQPSALDLREEPRRGDVSPRDRDRCAFLEVLLGTREALWLSYVALEPKGGQVLGPSSVVLELADAIAPYCGAASSRVALEALTRRVPLHRFSAPGELPAAVTRERWAVRTRDALHAHLRARGYAIPAEDGLHALLAHGAPEALREELGLLDPSAEAPPEPGAMRALTISNLRAFLEWPVQAWAQTVLGLDELPDAEAIENADEPFGVEPMDRAPLLRDVLAAQLMDGGGAGEVAARYDAIVHERELRGQFPVGVFGAAQRALDLAQLARWRDALGPVAVGTATRLAFGRSTSERAELHPALELALSATRAIRMIGQTELLLRDGERYVSVIALTGRISKPSRYHLRGALDHAVLAAAGFAAAGHAHVLLDKAGEAVRIDHAPWPRDEARAYLAALARELVEAPHGYLLPFDYLVKALAGGTPGGLPELGKLLGFGPIDRIDGLEPPSDAAAIAERRLAPLVDRMTGEHGLGGSG